MQAPSSPRRDTRTASPFTSHRPTARSRSIRSCRQRTRPAALRSLSFKHSCRLSPCVVVLRTRGLQALAPEREHRHLRSRLMELRQLSLVLLLLLLRRAGLRTPSVLVILLMPVVLVLVLLRLRPTLVGVAISWSTSRRMTTMIGTPAQPPRSSRSVIWGK